MVGIPDSVYRAWHGPIATAWYEYPHILAMATLIPIVMVLFPTRRMEVLSMIALMELGGCLIWWLFPVAPPWLLLKGGAMPVSAGVAQYCSTPSYHVAFAMLVARYFGTFGKCYAVFMSCCVVFTGNHYMVDVVTGDILFYAALGLYGLCNRQLSSAYVRVRTCWTR